MNTEGTDRTERIDPKVESALRRASLVLYAIVLLIGATAFAWWLVLGAGVGSSAPLMEPNSAVCLVLLASAGLLTTRNHVTAARLLCVVAAALAGATTAENLAGIDLRIDEALFEDRSTSSIYPGRSAVNTSLALLLASSALLLSRRYDARAEQSLILASAAIGLLALIGHAIGRDGFTGVTSVTSMAVPTAMAIVLFALAHLAADPGRGWTMTIAAVGPGGSLARWLVPTVIVVPVLVGYAAFRGVEAGLWDTAGSHWILLLATIVMLLATVFWIAHSLQALEAERGATREHTESFLGLSRDLLCTVDEAQHFAELNANWTRVLGYGLDELRSRPAIEFVHRDDRQSTIELHKLALERPEADIVIENRYRARDGSWRWLSWSIRPGHGRVHLYGRATDITLRKQEEERLIHLARHDSLTSLANRHDFDVRVADHLICGGRGALLAIDLDDLKGTNDADGHAAGDELLRSASRLLRQSLRQSDLVARIGGDEFAVLLPEADLLTASAVAEKLVRILAHGEGDCKAPVASVGVAVVDSPISGPDLLARADRALYAAKRAGGRTYRNASERAAPPSGTPSRVGATPGPQELAI